MTASSGTTVVLELAATELRSFTQHCVFLHTTLQRHEESSNNTTIMSTHWNDMIGRVIDNVGIVTLMRGACRLLLSGSCSRCARLLNEGSLSEGGDHGRRKDKDHRLCLLAWLQMLAT